MTDGTDVIKLSSDAESVANSIGTKAQTQEFVRGLIYDAVQQQNRDPEPEIGAAALLRACREENEGVDVSKIAATWRNKSLVDGDPTEQSILREFSRLYDTSNEDEPSLSVIELFEPRSLADYPDGTEELAKKLLKIVEARTPVFLDTARDDAVAAAIVYAATQRLDGPDRSQPTVAELFGTTVKDLRTTREQIEYHVLSALSEVGTQREDFDAVTASDIEQIEIDEVPGIASVGVDPGDITTEAYEEAAILHGDIRNSTTLVRLFESADRFVNRLLRQIENTIEDHGGEVRKKLGDGVLAIWDGEEAPVKVVECAKSILDEDIEAVSKAYPFDVSMGFGITYSGGGTVEEVQIEGAESQLFGEEVNLATRLEGLSKRLEADIVVDEATKRELGGDPAAYHVPQRDLSGFERPRDVYVVQNRDGTEASQVERFNRAAAALEQGFYSEALDFFAAEYTDEESVYEKGLIETLTLECFERYDPTDRTEQQRDFYTRTETEKRRDKPLRDRLREHLDTSTDSVPRVLEIGCGRGELLEQLCAEFDAEFVGIDTSPEVIKSATERVTADSVRFQRRSTAQLDPTREFDIVYVSSPLYSVPDYETVLSAVQALTDDGGRLLIQQATPEFASELRDTAEDILTTLVKPGLQFHHPLQFRTQDEIKRALSEYNWNPEITEYEVEGINPEQLASDFEKVGLVPYERACTNDLERRKLHNAFTERVRDRLNEWTGRVLLIDATVSTKDS